MTDILHQSHFLHPPLIRLRLSPGLRSRRISAQANLVGISLTDALRPLLHGEFASHAVVRRRTVARKRSIQLPTVELSRQAFRFIETTGGVATLRQMAALVSHLSWLVAWLNAGFVKWEARCVVMRRGRKRAETSRIKKSTYPFFGYWMLDLSRLSGGLEFRAICSKNTRLAKRGCFATCRSIKRMFLNRPDQHQRPFGACSSELGHIERPKILSALCRAERAHAATKWLFTIGPPRSKMRSRGKSTIRAASTLLTAECSDFFPQSQNRVAKKIFARRAHMYNVEPLL